jgi:hypothetical protein
MTTTSYADFGVASLQAGVQERFPDRAPLNKDQAEYLDCPAEMGIYRVSRNLDLIEPSVGLIRY